MSTLKPANQAVMAPATQPRDWNSAIGWGAAAALVIVAPFMYFVAAGIRANYLLTGG